MADSYSKKENNKKKIKKQQDKLLRRSDRKVNNNKGKSLEDMLIYVDANGALTSTPPHLQLVEKTTANKELESNTQIQIESSIGTITYINDNGYGFITENVTRDNVFFNFENNSLYKKNLKVRFKKEISPKGFRAKNIVIIN